MTRLQISTIIYQPSPLSSHPWPPWKSYKAHWQGGKWHRSTLQMPNKMVSELYPSSALGTRRMWLHVTMSRNCMTATFRISHERRQSRKKVIPVGRFKQLTSACALGRSKHSLVLKEIISRFLSHGQIAMVITRESGKRCWVVLPLPPCLNNGVTVIS